MKEIELKLRAGMARNGIAQESQEKIIRSITSFALYGFPESHAASFALLAYASAYLKCHYLAAFTAAMLNNQPMGFYNPATLVKDAQRHGLKMRPIDVTCSDWLCTLEFCDGQFSARLGMRYVRGLRVEIAEKIAHERAARAFTSIEELKFRVPEIQKAELTTLAEIGALNFIGAQRAKSVHRRDALWQVERASRNAGPLFMDEAREEAVDELNAANSPLRAMSPEERLVADFSGTGMTVGLHPMGYHRAKMKELGVRSATELGGLPDGTFVRVAGGVIARQRPGTAKGFCFLSLEDETGIANAILTPQVYEKNHLVIVHQQFLLVEGPLQNQDGVVSVKVEGVRGISISRAAAASHDFH
jgi:error-prone DNA polymerase